MKPFKKLVKAKQSGFTLIELMIVIAIIGILAAIAVPQYQTYTKKAKFTEIISAVNPFKVAVELCYADQGTLANCSAGVNGVPADPTSGTAVLSTLTTGANGVITATGTAVVDSKTYVLTPTPGAAGNTASLTWAKTGTCAAAGYC